MKTHKQTVQASVNDAVLATTPPYRKREIMRSIQRRLITRCAKWFREDFGHLEDYELVESLRELGYNELNDMFIVEVALEDDGMISAEIRAELSYGGLHDLGIACNPIVQKYDKDAYFDMVQPGIMRAYLDLDKVYRSVGNGKVYSATSVTDGTGLSSTHNDDYYEYSFMVGDQLEWIGSQGSQYKGVVTDVNDEYVTVDFMQTAEDTGDTVMHTKKFEISVDPEGKECIIVWTYGSDARYVYPPSNDYINSTKGANYGGAYDIDPESYFTREDLDELGYSVAELVSLDIGDTVEYAGAWIEPNNELTVDLKSSDYDSSVTLKVYMRKIRRPEYLIARYAERIADESAAQIREAMNAEERIESSTAINAGYWDEPEDDWIEVDDVTDVIEVDIDGTQITVTADGKYDWTEQEHDWAKDNEIDIPELGTWIALDEYRVEDDVWEMISDMLPEPQSEDRTYTVDGTIRLCYTVSGMLARADGSVREPDDDFGWGYQTMADAVDIEFNYEKSDVVSFHVE